MSKNKIDVYDNVHSVSLPGHDGRISVWKNHAESFLKLSDGKIVIKNDIEHTISIKTAVAYISNNIVTIII